MSGEPFDMNDDTGVGASGLRGVGAGEAPLAVAVGDLLDGRYRVGEPLGKGGMGYVFAATDERLRRPVAMKVIRPEFARHPDVVARFEREALASSRLSSPHVVVVHDFGTTEQGLLYLIMERLEGTPLGRRLKDGGAMEPSQALEVAQQVARALEAAHAAGITHRDLKPANVFLCSDGNAKVLDFGIAKIAEPEGGAFGGGAGLTSTGMMLGTPLFMSPEAASPHGSVGPPSDIYALGTLLFSMLAGQPPFSHQEPVVVMSMHMRDAAPRVHDLSPDVAIGEDAERLVRRMLAKDPAARPTAPEALAALGALLTDPLAGEAFSTDFAEAATDVEPLPTAPPTEAPQAPSAGLTISLRALAFAGAALIGLLSLLAGVAFVLLVSSEDESGDEVSAIPLEPRASEPDVAGAMATLEADTVEADTVEADTVEADTVEADTVEADTDEQADDEQADDEQADDEQADDGQAADEPAADQPAADQPAAGELERVGLSPAMGRLVVEVSPGGTVILDGTPLGRAPVDAPVEVGAHRLVVRRRGQVEERRVVIAQGETTRESVRFVRRTSVAPRTTSSGSGADLSGIPDEW